MSIRMIMLNNENKSEQSSDLQFLPSKVISKGEESSNKHSFFACYSKTNNPANMGTITNTIRGYPVVGHTFNIQKTLLGMVFEEDKKPLSDDANRTFRQKCVFDHFTCWNYDKIPSENDTLQKAVEDFILAEEIQNTINPEELSAYIQTKEK